MRKRKQEFPWTMGKHRGPTTYGTRPRDRSLDRVIVRTAAGSDEHRRLVAFDRDDAVARSPASDSPFIRAKIGEFAIWLWNTGRGL